MPRAGSASAARLIAALALLCMLAGCAAFHPVKERLEPLRLASPCEGRADTLLVFLPGRYDAPDDIVGHGFVATLQSAGAHADVAIPDLHLGYYLENSAVTRLREDIVLPARRAGYRHIWFAGISLGGLGALLYLQQHPDEADGAFLIAPYLGEDAIRRDIAAAGGLERWTGAAPGAKEEERQLWLWLKQAAPRAGRPGWPQLVLGYGRQDRFAGIDALLAAVLPPGQATTTAGGHDWAPWLRIWNAMLAQGALAECAASRQPVPGS